MILAYYIIVLLMGAFFTLCKITNNEEITRFTIRILGVFVLVYTTHLLIGYFK